MPGVINGIGTWYYGRRNVHVGRARCENCGRVATISSYDTTLYFVVLFVPLLPLGGRRVMRQCSACSRHGVMPLKKFEILRAAEVKKAVNAYCEDPQSEERAIAAIHTVVGFCAVGQFDGLAALLTASLPNNGKVLSMLAAGYEYFGRHEEAIDAYRRALAAGHDPETADALAVLLMSQRRADEAAGALKYILRDQVAAKADLLALLAEAYQAEGRHAEALHVLEEIARVFPELAQDATLRRLRGVSEQHQGTGRAVVSARLPRAGAGLVATSRWASRLPRLVLPAIAAGALLIYLIVSAGLASGREVRVVNGLTQPYTVTVGGQNVKLQPQGIMMITLSEGDYDLACDGAGVNIPPQRVAIHTPFFKRAFSSPMIVLNPDRGAVLEEQTVAYGSTTVAPVEALHVGQAVYIFNSVDYPFCDFPPSINVPNTDRVHMKRRVGLNGLPNGVALFEHVAKARGLAAAKTLVLEQIQKDTVSNAYIHAAATFDDLDFRTLFAARLAQRPINMTAHRAYQDWAAKRDPGAVIHEYEALLQAQPESTALLYLMGRANDDAGVARGFYRRAVEGSSPEPYGFHALAYDALCTGNFAEAATNWQKAIGRTRDPEAVVEFRARRCEALMGAGDWRGALDLIRERLREAPPLLQVAMVPEELSVMERAGFGGGTDARIEAFVAELGRTMSLSPTDVESARQTFQAYRNYARGDRSAFTKGGGGGPVNRFRDAVGNFRAAEASALIQESAAPSALLLVAIVARHTSDAKVAEPAAGRAAALLSRAGRHWAKAGDWITLAAVPSDEDLRQLDIPPEEKRLVLTLLAQLYPARRSAIAAIARPYNFNPEFPYLTLKDVLGD